MKITLDTDRLANNSDPQELTSLETVLRGFLDFIRALQGKKEALPEAPLSTPPKPPVNDPPKDPVGDVIIEGLKQNQRQAMIPRKSGWMSIGFGKVDDKHI